MMKVKCITGFGETKIFEIPKIVPYIYEIYLYRFPTTSFANNIIKDIDPQLSKMVINILTITDENVKFESTYSIDKPKKLSINFSLPLEAAIFLGLNIGLDTCNAIILYQNEYNIDGQDFINSKQTSTLLNHFHHTINHINMEKKKLEVHFNSVDVELKACYKYMIEAALEGKDHVCLGKGTCTEKLAQKLKDAHFDIEESKDDFDHLCGYIIRWSRKEGVNI